MEVEKSTIDRSASAPAQAEDDGDKKPASQPKNNEGQDKDQQPAPRILHGPTIDGDSIDFPLSHLENHLICPLCKGYFRDPYTVADCLHSFCRSCLIVHFRVGHRRCPTCNLSLEPDPFREVLADRTLQEVVDKIFPWMRKKEDEEEKAFYAARGIKLKPEYETVDSSKRKGKGGEGSKGGVKGAPSSKESTKDMINLQLEPYEPESITSLPPLRNPILRTSGRLKIISIKKYLLQRLGLKDSHSAIEILCNGDPMGNEHSLTFILRTRWFTPNKMMTLQYSLAEGGGM